MWITSSLDTVLTPTAVALGNFDGVHQGHRQVIRPVLECVSPTGEAAHATVVTFYPHPQEFFTGQRRHILTPLHEKIALLKAIGVNQLVLLPFNRELASLSPEAFVKTILVEHLQACRVSVGSNFCFGQKRSGTVADLQAIGADHGIEVAIAPLAMLAEERVSSSAIRQALQAGKIPQANRLLGRSYRLIGQVVGGQQRGRTIGFPTANLQLPAEKFLPRQGVYAVKVYLGELDEHGQLPTTMVVPGVMNLGIRPTVDGSHETVEVHLLDWSGDLYGKNLCVTLEHFLRPEQKFASLDALKAQIQADCLAAKALFSTVPRTPNSENSV